MRPRPETPRRMVVYRACGYFFASMGFTVQIDMVVPNQCLKLSGFAAQTLADAGKLDMATLDFHRKYTN